MYLDIIHVFLDEEYIRLVELSIVQKDLLDVSLKSEAEITKQDSLNIHYGLLNCTPSIKVTQIIKYS